MCPHYLYKEAYLNPINPIEHFPFYIGMTEREFATVLVALRSYQDSPNPDKFGMFYEGSADDIITPLTDDEIDDFIERINTT